MARSDAYKSSTESPVKKYLSWSSNDKCFTYYDRELKENKKLSLPLKFIHLDEMSTIKGWHDPSTSGIYSNEVRSTKNDSLTVRSFKGGELATGLYQDIKLKVNGLGGDYHASIYLFLNGEVVNLAIKGSALMTWSDFSKENKKAFLGSYIEVTGALDAKKGSVKYSVPVFTIGGSIELSVNEKAEDAYDNLQAYFKSRQEGQSAQAESPAGEIDHPVEFAPEPAFDLAKEDNPLPF
jgi:hypothetical protein